ncbi:MAG: hypothetical protein AAFR74_06945 [Pseudomonadota bacterium]
MRFGGLLFAVCVLLSGMAVAQSESTERNTASSAQASTIDDQRLNRAMRGLNGDDLQKERPVREAEPLPPPRERRQRSENGIAKFFADLFSGIGPVFGWTLVVIIALLLLTALYYMFGESLSLRRSEKVPKPYKNVSIAPDLMPDEAAARALLGDAETLASEGRFAEAVHALLFRSIDLIQERQPSAVKRSLTAREIGQLGGLPDLIRNGLSPIIRIVERSYFGGRDVDERSWREARDAYRSFALREAAA